MQLVSDDDVRKRLLEKPRFELAAKGVGTIQTGKMLHLLAGRSRSLGQQPAGCSVTGRRRRIDPFLDQELISYHSHLVVVRAVVGAAVVRPRRFNPH